MKNISKWASENTKKAKLLSKTIILVLVLVGFLYGKFLLSYNIEIPDYFKYIILGIVGLALFFYPFISRKGEIVSKLFRYSEKRKKMHDVTLTLSMLVMAIIISNNSYEAKIANIIPTASAAESFNYKQEIASASNISSEKAPRYITKKEKSNVWNWYIWKFILFTTLTLAIAFLGGIGIGLFSLVLSSGVGLPLLGGLVLAVGWLTLAVGVFVILRKLIIKFRNKEQYIEAGKKKPTKISKLFFKYIAVALMPIISIFGLWTSLFLLLGYLYNQE